MTEHEKRIREFCRVNQIAITQVGLAWRFSGFNVSILTADFESLAISDLEQARGRAAPRSRNPAR